MADVIFTTKLVGVEDAVKALADIEKKARRRIVSAGIRAGNAVITKEARARAPKVTGALRASIRASVKLESSTGTVIGKVAAGKSSKAQQKKGQHAWYAHFVTGGTKPHKISVRRGGIPYKEGFYRTVMHPGAKPNPYMEQAADSAAHAAIVAFTKAFSEKLEAEVAK